MASQSPHGAATPCARSGLVWRSHTQAKTAEDLLEAIPEAAVNSSRVIWPHPTKPGTYIFSQAAFDDVPMFDWGKWLLDGFHEGMVP